MLIICSFPLSTKILCNVQNDQKPAWSCTKVLLDLNSCTRWFDNFLHCIGFLYFRRKVHMTSQQIYINIYKLSCLTNPKCTFPHVCKIAVIRNVEMKCKKPKGLISLSQFLKMERLFQSFVVILAVSSENVSDQSQYFTHTVALMIYEPEKVCWICTIT